MKLTNFINQKIAIIFTSICLLAILFTITCGEDPTSSKKEVAKVVCNNVPLLDLNFSQPIIGGYESPNSLVTPATSMTEAQQNAILMVLSGFTSLPTCSPTTAIAISSRAALAYAKSGKDCASIKLSEIALSPDLSITEARKSESLNFVKVSSISTILIADNEPGAFIIFHLTESLPSSIEPIVIAPVASVDLAGTSAIYASHSPSSFIDDSNLSRRWASGSIIRLDDPLNASLLPIDVHPVDSQGEFFIFPDHPYISPCRDNSVPIIALSKDDNNIPMLIGMGIQGVPVISYGEENNFTPCFGEALIGLPFTNKNIAEIKQKLPDLKEASNTFESSNFPDICSTLGEEGVCLDHYALFCDQKDSKLRSHPCFGRRGCGLNNEGFNRCIPCDQ